MQRNLTNQNLVKRGPVFHSYIGTEGKSIIVIDLVDPESPGA